MAEPFAYTLEVSEGELEEIQRSLNKLSEKMVQLGADALAIAAVSDAVDKFSLIQPGQITATLGQWHAVHRSLDYRFPMGGIGAGPSAISIHDKLVDAEVVAADEVGGDAAFMAAAKAEAAALAAEVQPEPAEAA